MQTNKTIGQFVHYPKDMGSASKHRIAWIILLLALFSNGAYAFSVGAVQGLNCGAIYQPTCTYAAGLAFYETVHQNITEDALIQPSVAFTPPGGAQCKFKYKHRIQIEDANMETDFDQSNHDKHFDNEQFSLGEKRLDDLEFKILGILEQKRVIDRWEAERARALFGGYLHTLQDFFAHSSWVNSHPSIRDVPTFWVAGLNLTPTFSYPCIDNIDPITGETYPWDPNFLATDNPLTTGYAGSFLSLLRGDAPYGKCAHGLVDNGIHKDWTGRDFHTAARAQAVYASAEAAKYIINYPDNNPDNVCMFMTDKPCSGVSWLKFAQGDPGWPGDGKVINLELSAASKFYPNDTVPMLKLLTPIKFKDVAIKNLFIGMFLSDSAQDMLLVGYSNGLSQSDSCYVQSRGVIGRNALETINLKQGVIFSLRQGSGLAWGGIYNEVDLANQSRPSECPKMTLDSLSITHLGPINTTGVQIDGMFVRAGLFQ